MGWQNWFSRFFFRNPNETFLPFKYWGASPVFNNYGKDIEKLNAVFSNPAVLKIFTLQCDLFSLGKPYVYADSGPERKNDPALDRLNNPNYMQGRAQWMWDYMFWKMLGNAYLYMSSDVVERSNAPMYWLENHKIEWPNELEREKDKLILSQAKLNKILNTVINYRYDDGTSQTFQLREILSVHDLTNGTGNWFKGFSRLDALYKVICNSEISLDSKNINVRYTAKFLVSGQQDPKDITKTPLSNDEKIDIERKINGESWQEKIDGKEKQVHAVKSMVDIKRFVDDLRVLELDKSFLSDFFLIGSMYNIPRDVLELYTSSTYENQEKARAGHVTYTLEPAGEALGDMLSKRWGYTNKKIIFSWDHLPFTQVFEDQKATTQLKKTQIFTTLLRAGVPIEEINVFLDTNFTIKTSQNVEETVN